MNKKELNKVLASTIKNMDELGKHLCQKNKQTEEERTCEGCEYYHYKSCILSTFYWSLYQKMERN